MMIICDTCVGIHIRIYNKEVLVMSASKDTKRGTWKVYIRYKDWQGVGQVHTKRCQYGISTVRGGLYGGYEAEVEIEHIFNQEAHYGNEDYSIF